MAKPIEPTPILDKEASLRFLSQVEADLKVPTYAVPTPKLAEARRKALQHAVLGPKSTKKGEGERETFDLLLRALGNEPHQRSKCIELAKQWRDL